MGGRRGNKCGMVVGGEAAGGGVERTIDVKKRSRGGVVT